MQDVIYDIEKESGLSKTPLTPARSLYLRIPENISENAPKQVSILDGSVVDGPIIEKPLGILMENDKTVTDYVELLTELVKNVEEGNVPFVTLVERPYHVRFYYP